MEIRGILLITITIITPIPYPRFELLALPLPLSIFLDLPRPLARTSVPRISDHRLFVSQNKYPIALSFLPSLRIQSTPPPVGRANFFLSNHRGLLPYHSPVSLIQGDSAPRESQPPPIFSEKKIEKRKGAREVAERERCVEATVKITD